MVTVEQRSELDETTAFERYAIDSSIPAIDNPMNSASIDLRPEPGEIAAGFAAHANVAIGVSENMSAGAITATVSRLRPLIFGAAFKVLDLMLELALEVSGKTPNRGTRWTMTEKVPHARQAAGDLPPLTDTFPEAWAQAMLLYVRFEEVRHSLVHRTAQVDQTTGDLVGRDRAELPLASVSASDQEQFSRLASELADAVIANRLSDRARRRIGWRLNELQHHHRATTLVGATRPQTAVDVKVNFESLPNGAWRLNAKAALDRAKSVFQAAAEFNGIVYAVTDNDQRVFRCNLEDAPNDGEIDLNALPSWLEEIPEANHHF